MALEDVLNPQERLLFHTRRHWLPCAPGLIVLSLLGIATAVLLGLYARAPVGRLFAEQTVAAAVLAGLLALVVVVPWLVLRFMVRTHEYGVTDRRVIARMGWIAKRTVDLNVAKVETMVVEQGALGRMFGYGDVKVVGTGGTAEMFHGMRDPIGFRKAVNASADGTPAEASA